MKKFFLRISFICASLLLLTALSGAELREGGLELSPFFGYCTGSTARELCHKDIYGLRLGYNITKNWGIEGAFERVGANAATMLQADLLFHLMPEKTFNPFVLAGVGGGHVRPQKGNSYDTVMGNIGAGFKYGLSENIYFRTELRDVITHSHNSVITAGLTFVFGGKTSKPVTAVAPQPGPGESAGTVSAPQLGPEKKAEAVPVPEASQVEPLPAPASGPVKIILEDIHLDFNKASLTKEAKEILDRNIKILKEHPGLNVLIEGHACAHGSAKANMRLSAKRANVVKAYLVKQGVPAHRVTTVAYGETRLLIPEIPTKYNRNAKEVKANRRVHIEVKE